MSRWTNVCEVGELLFYANTTFPDFVFDCSRLLVTAARVGRVEVIT
ncbi:hypothetical protein [Robertmurraya siralis]|nr:hypothetical protein [Robertmurraya siralis]